MARFEKEYESLLSSVVRKSSIFVLFIAIVIFMLGLNGREPLDRVQRPAEDFGAQVTRVLSMPIRGGEKLISNVGAHFYTVAENKRLTAELERLKLLEQQDSVLQEQVRYLEALLNTQLDTINAQDPIAARAVSENDGPFAKSALLNAGQSRGVFKGQAVMTTDGMYGRVVRSGRMSARVLLLNDLSSRIPVMSLRSRGRAILTGNNATEPVLDFRGDSDWQVGDKVVTSGDDGALPRGLPVGEVVMLAQANAISDAVLGVTLYTDANPVDWVRIIPYEPVQTPEDNPAAEDNLASGVEGAVDLGDVPAIAATPQEPQELSAQTAQPSEGSQVQP